MNVTMSTVTVRRLPRLRALPEALPLEGAVRIELEEGILVFKASDSMQARIEGLLSKAQDVGLTAEEGKELDRYEEMDDYLSFVNRVARNLIQPQPGEET